MAEALMIAGTVVSVAGTLVGGAQEAAAYKASAKVENELANYRAKQLQQNAGQERAAGQHKAEEERRQARLARSRARAVGGASGAIDGSDVENIMAGLTAEGEYNAKSALYESEEAARGMESQADAERYSAKINSAMAKSQAKSAKVASYYSAAGNILSGGSTFYDKFWPDAASTGTGSLSMSRSGTKFGPRSSQVAYG